MLMNDNCINKEKSRELRDKWVDKWKRLLETIQETPLLSSSLRCASFKVFLMENRARIF